MLLRVNLSVPHKLIPSSTFSIYEESAHMPFWEEPAKFNGELSQFVQLTMPA